MSPARQATKTAFQTVEGQLKRAPKKGLTAHTIAERTAVKHTTVQVILSRMVRAGQAQVSGSVPTGGPGRPRKLYKLA